MSSIWEIGLMCALIVSSIWEMELRRAAIVSLYGK